MRIRQDIIDVGELIEKPIAEFPEIELPECVDIPASAWTLSDNPTYEERAFSAVTEYSHSRLLSGPEVKWSPANYILGNQVVPLKERLIIPCYYHNKVVGWVARHIKQDVRPKYFAQTPSDFVFNIDAQTDDREVVIVVEGIIDALLIGGVSGLGNEISDEQASIIEMLHKRVIVVPDNDKAGKEMVNAALEYGWEVSFPDWFETVKDCAAAVERYGKLFTVASIIANAEKNPLKIQLLAKKMKTD
jgi:hypothetical protein